MVQVQHYELLGAHPRVEGMNLEGSIADWRKMRSGVMRSLLGRHLAMAAEHFFGLSLNDYRDMNQLVDAMLAMNSELQVH